MRQAGVPSGLVQTYDRVFQDPHLLARDFFPDAPHPKLGAVRQLGSPIRMSAAPTAMKRAGPLLGEHSLEVLAELGYTREEADQLLQAGTIRIPR
jgi:formyl-CoA transferase